MSARFQPLDTVLDSSVDIALAEQALALAKARAKWATCKDFYLPIINALQRVGVEPALSGNDINVQFSGDKAKLAAVMRILRTSGFTFTANRPKQGDSDWHCYFHHPDSAVPVWLYFTSSVCRRVQVGTKMVETPIYETKCGDISIDDDAPALPSPSAPIAEIEACPF